MLPARWLGFFACLLITFLLAAVIPSSVIAQGYADVILLPDSTPTFYHCGSTEKYKGASTLPGHSVADSTNIVLTDRDPDTSIGGKAKFEVGLKNSSLIANEDGADLIVAELEGKEVFQISVFADGSNNFSKPKRFMANATSSEKNECNQDVNYSLIDLSLLGIPHGSIVSKLRFDNIGVPGCCIGSEIVDIFVIHNYTESSKLGDIATLQS